MNRVMLVGYVAWDPELKRTKGDRAMLAFGLLTEESLKHKQLKSEERTVCHRVVAFGNLANESYEFLKRGAKVFLEGKLHPQTWKTGEGQPRYSTEVVCYSIELLQESKRKASAYDRTVGNGEDREGIGNGRSE